MPFPLKFDPAEWRGPRASQFVDRSDIFQQVVGDLLRERFGTHANVVPTAGRDGSIDAFVEGVEHGLGNMATAQIVECKDHDDTLTRYLDNVDQGWADVAKKLRTQAKAGWPGHYQPWVRARSYAYCISSVLPNQQARDALHGRIKDFFDQLPSNQKPPIEAICVFDWSDLRDLFDRNPRVADGWLGTRLSLILGHDEHCSTLTRFRRYLLSNNLPFVPPEAGADSAPQALLNRLDSLSGGNGILITGVGGIGKTRTTLEVGHLAQANGWRVLHVLPGEPGVTIEELAGIVLEGNFPTLLTFDYLDQMPAFDFGGLRRRLLPEAEKRGLRLALLANLRPSALRMQNPERDALFTELITLKPTELQSAQIAERALEQIAPQAVAQLGLSRVRDLCGDRPIIGMLIAEELQRRAVNHTLTTINLADLRRGDLLTWLRKRLTQDCLVVAGTGGFLPSQPETPLVAAAAMLAVAPLDVDEMQAAGTAACEAAGGDGLITARLALRSLLDLGWLEQHGNDLSTAHDVVADEVLTQVLWDRTSGCLRDATLSACLAPALHRARVLGRTASALTRLLGPEATETPREAALRTQAGVWLRTHATPLGWMLDAADPRESAYALGGIVSAPAWATICIEEWSKLIAPWLARHGSNVQARHLLYRGLKQLPEGTASDLLAAALRWLPHHLSHDTASYVLNALLGRSDLDDHAPSTIAFALKWLQVFGHTEEASFVLSALLERRDLEEHATGTIAFALDWLQAFGDTEAASFVFQRLLGRSDLDDHSPGTIAFALGWLQTFGHTEGASFVLNALLGRSDLDDHAPSTIAFALKWLHAFGHNEGANFVFHELLMRSDLDHYAPDTIAFALDWLPAFGDNEEAKLVLKALLGRSDLDDHSPGTIAFALGWLQTFGHTEGASFVLNALLGRRDLGIHETRSIVLALAWLKVFPQIPSTGYVLKRMFGLKSLNQAQHSYCVAMAVTQLEHLGHNKDASHLLKACLSDRDVDQVSAARLMVYALDWIKANPDADGADFVFNRLLSLRNVPKSTWTDTSQIALAWLRKHPAKVNRDLGLAALLRRAPQLPAADLRWVLQEAREWLQNPPSGAHHPNKLMSSLEYFHRQYDSTGEQFPTDILKRWQVTGSAGIPLLGPPPTRTDD